MDNATEVADVLERAAHVIERDGWWDGGRKRTRSNAACALMALGRASDELLGEGVSRKATIEFEKRWLGGRPAERWNDEEGRTEFDVINAFRLCAKDIRNEASV